MSSRVYVGGIPYETRERDLENFFRGFGRIRDVLIKNGWVFKFDNLSFAMCLVFDGHSHGIVYLANLPVIYFVLNYVFVGL